MDSNCGKNSIFFKNHLFSSILPIVFKNHLLSSKIIYCLQKSSIFLKNHLFSSNDSYPRANQCTIDIQSITNLQYSCNNASQVDLDAYNTAQCDAAIDGLPTVSLPLPQVCDNNIIFASQIHSSLATCVLPDIPLIDSTLPTLPTLPNSGGPREVVERTEFIIPVVIFSAILFCVLLCCLAFVIGYTLFLRSRRKKFVQWVEELPVLSGPYNNLKKIGAGQGRFFFFFFC